ncbi:FHA domain-containing protein [Desulfallas thermosapovorans]|uniref:FHA domain-containing protein n=1 Tax=Desulfallas thermosapovorans DSM 6562 TaxID=1121431 RepID=A0A5S4ZWJ6_9FIRM|nr:FHA domain-containing protein [Desulfallas thermosapovorans]TYO97377.1 FHA domain-containing protein [Desulfallas thermosapovorans DSM 6562]
MDIVLFVLRTAFIVLIYVFIFIVLIHLIKDLHNTAEPRAGNTAAMREGGAYRVAAPAGMERSGPGVLVVESAPAEYDMEGVEFALSRELRLGRGPNNEVILPDRFASNNHARLFSRDGQFWLEDLGSKNGTYLNGKPLAGPAVLANGDQIRIGEIIFKFVRWGYEVESDHRVRSGTPKK